MTLFDRILGEATESDSDRSVLQIGCADGAFLGRALAAGWRVFGVEPLGQSRDAIQRQLDTAVALFADVTELFAHRFDVVVFVGTLEHVPDPLALFYELFAKGAITETTKVVVAINGRSAPPSVNPSTTPMHSADDAMLLPRALDALFTRLRFRHIDVQRIDRFSGEAMEVAGDHNESNAADAIYCVATDSNFGAFMRERYVPGTWSLLACYEHLPRYLYARSHAVGSTVLDFGCGTGYGAALLASVARSVTAIDIDAATIEWARSTHAQQNLKFAVDARLGRDLPEGAFDLVTCFEVIEHISAELQDTLVASIARVCAAKGITLVSTPNPAVSRLYGENPFHKRELERAEFAELMQKHFRYVVILDQFIHPAITLTSGAADGNAAAARLERLPAASGAVGAAMPVVFLAICSNAPVNQPAPLSVVDLDSPFVPQQLRMMEALDKARSDRYQALRRLSMQSEHAVRAADEAERLRSRIAAQGAELQRVHGAVEQKDALLMAQISEVNRLRSEVAECASRLALAQRLHREAETARARNASELAAIQTSNWHQLGNALRQRPLKDVELQRIVRLGGKMLWMRLQPSRAPRTHVTQAVPVRARGRVSPDSGNPTVSAHAPYIVRVPVECDANRLRVVHVLGNFMLGGSSRLVVDLIERLGHRYDQRVVTSHVPSPPAYIGADVIEVKAGATEGRFMAALVTPVPDLIHVHYWGDTDEPWYRRVFAAASRIGCPIIENVNTPVSPFRSAQVERYVFVSDYVKQHFGDRAEREQVIRPGSDFSIFRRSEDHPPDPNSVGMVYRLERDKLDARAIEPLIRVVQRRPQTRAIVVGGGTLLERFRRRVQVEELTASFTFTGYVAYEVLPTIYADLSVFVAPVWRESFGQVGPFAMSMGIPVCGYGVGAIPEIVDDPALCARPGDAEQLADIVIGLLEDPERRFAIGVRQQRRARELYSVESMVGRYSDLYGELLESRR